MLSWHLDCGTFSQTPGEKKDDPFFNLLIKPVQEICAGLRYSPGLGSILIIENECLELRLHSFCQNVFTAYQVNCSSSFTNRMEVAA